MTPREEVFELPDVLALGASAWADADAAAPSFGDVVEGGWLHDVYVRGDSQLLGGGTLPANLADKFATWVDQPRPGADLDVLSAAFEPSDQDRYALAHASFRPGQTLQAVVLSDSCHVLTCLGLREGRSARDRVLLAPIIKGDAQTHARLAQTRPLGRMPLPGHDRLGDHPIAELRFVFAADARTYREHLERAMVHLRHERVLADFWAGFATRRGVLVTERNLFKLAAVTEGQLDQPSQSSLDRMNPLADLTDLVRVIEEYHLERASDAAEILEAEAKKAGQPLGGDWAAKRGQQLAQEITTDLVEQLTALREVADQAIAALSN